MAIVIVSVLTPAKAEVARRRKSRCFMMKMDGEKSYG
jgi:hypothetical protein